MTIPSILQANLRLPAIVAPMFLTSGPELVVACCRAGLIGTFPALNQRSSEGFRAWLVEIEERLKADSNAAPFGVNLIVHKSNPRLAADLKIVSEHRVPLVITSLGVQREVIETVHGYGGVVFHDVISRRHAEKAAEAGVDGIIAVCAGAGGHGGTLNPFALVSEIASFFDGTIVLSGAISTGQHIAAARMMGADMAYLGTRFIATQEALVDDAHKQMVVAATSRDIIYTANVSGVSANFLRPSLERLGLDPDNLPVVRELDMGNEAKAWKTIWSAGQGVGAISDIPTAGALCSRLIEEYGTAVRGAAGDPYLAIRAQADA